jgi:hypothetical protein
MAIEKEIWRKDIQEAVFDDNSFLDDAFNADENVIGGAVVHIPQSGGAGNIEKNRSTFPATIRRRTDTDIVYVLDEYTSDPVKITDADKKELSYDKRKSVIGEDTEAVKQLVADDFLYKWASSLPAGSILLTTGDAVAASAPGATGQRLAAVLGDLQRAQTEMDAQGVSEANRFAMIPARLRAQLFPIGSAVIQAMMQNVTPEERKKGIIGEVCGFKLRSRTKAAIYSNAGTLKAPGAVSAVDDDEAIVCWQKNAVERAKGTIDFFEDLKNPTEYGDIYSMLVRAGGRRRRADDTGVITIRQAKAA